MTTPQESESPRPDRRLLVGAVVLLLAAAVLLWGASAVQWADQRYRTPFSGEQTAGVTGAMLRPELGPLALATLAAVAALLATGGWIRRLVGLLVVLEGGLLGWRLIEWMLGSAPTPEIPDAPPGSEPVGQVATSPVGPLLMMFGAVLLFGTGTLITVWARRMPAMGAKYSAPAAAKRDTRDPDRRLWDALNDGEDPTESES